MSEPIILTHDILNGWADGAGPSALVLNEKLISVEGREGVIFPPTYSDIGYNIDELCDGTKIAQIDSVGSQANRMEPLFKKASQGAKANPLAKLTPQIIIRAGEDKCVHLFDAGHRLGDAIVRCSNLGAEADLAFKQYCNGDSTGIAKMAPTTLLFGAWNSRSQDNQAKIPRIVQGVIRAFDVEVLHRAAQYNPAINYELNDLLGPIEGDDRKTEGDVRSQCGFRHAPAVWRDNDKTKDDKNRIFGGVLVRGEIRRTVTINLVALRALGGGEDGGQKLRRYILGLSLAAATASQDGFLRQGCILVHDWEIPEPSWQAVYPSKKPEFLSLDYDLAIKYAESVADAFGVGSDREDIIFDLKLARAELDEKKNGKGKKSAKTKK
jgi:CRISPR-associated protein Csb1